MNRIKIHLGFLTIATALAILSSCATSNTVMVNVGLQRSDMTQWSIRRCAEAEIQVDIPKDAYRFWESSSRVSLCLHPVYPPRHIIDEPQMLLTVTFNRSTCVAQKNDSEGVLKYLTNATERTHWAWEYAFHSNTEVWVCEPWSYYRRDYIQNSNTLWVGRAELLRVKEGDRLMYLDEDDKVIRRIFDSFAPRR